MTFLGMPVYASDLLVIKKTVRVRGGYLNRWLIRAEMTVPNPRLLVDEDNRRVYGHPVTLAAIRTAAAHQTFN